MSVEQRRWSRERRSAWLRLVAFAILAVNLGLASPQDNMLVHANVIMAYGAATIIALLLAEYRRGTRRLAWVYVAFDALIVVVLFHEHLFAPGMDLDHAVTAPSLAIGFVLLTHVALRLRPVLVFLFSGLVILGWLALLTVAVEAHLGKSAAHVLDWPAFLTEAALAAAFAFAALVCGLLTYDHNFLLRPAVLAEFRELVKREVFAHGGMIDKFIGDGVMAAFGQPKSTSDDAARALHCALHLTRRLRDWREARERRGEVGPRAGIGLHFGMAIGGVLRSGTHDEFTLVGDAVNVAQRLERLCKPLDASIVASWESVSAGGGESATGWQYESDVELEGRRQRMRIAYVPNEQG